MEKRVIVIGGGASGMTAAIFAARQGAEVTILEHMDRVGKKILSTGNGKCNFSNRRMEALCYRSGDPAFPMKVLEQFGVDRTVRFFEDLGIVIRDRDGYLYPRSGQASSILDVLRQEVERQGVRLVTSCETERILCQTREEASSCRFTLSTSRGPFAADAVILAAGSAAAPSTGSDGSGYRLAESLGLPVLKPLPALVQLKCRESFYRQISGVRADAGVALWSDGRLLAFDAGEVQLTDYGISGIPVFQVSRFASRALDEGKKVSAVLDFYPEKSHEETKRELSSRFISCGGKRMEDFFTGWFNKKLALLFCRLAGLDAGGLAGEVPARGREALFTLIKEFRTEIAGTNPLTSAQVCCGGVDVRAVRPGTLEAKKKKGLYLIGELLDVDGICGGYNLQWAWSTGAIAGTHAGQKE